jgi:ribosomal protein S18 acetylase RimI-like enzyme
METFEDSWEHTREPYDEWSHWMLERPGFDPNLWLLAATADDEIAGIALCRVHEADSKSGWVSILGVRRPWRRQGLGRALLLESFHRLAACGCERAILGVDASSLTGAHTLYASAGMSVISTFDIYELAA